MKPTHRTTLPVAALSGLTLAFTSAALHAQIAWDGGAGTTDYATALNWADDTIPGNGNVFGALIGNSSTQTVIYNTATSYTSTGTAAANLVVGTGNLTLSGSAGTLTFGGDGYPNAAWIGTSSGTDATGTVTVSAGKLAIGGEGSGDASINLGVYNFSGGARNGTLIIDGGIVEVGRRILMGANDPTTVSNLTISSGTLDMKRTGSNGEGDLGKIRFGGGTNTVNLDGGTAVLTGFDIGGASSARSNIFFNGTTLRANVANDDFLVGGTANANLILKNGGLVFDTNTFSVTINDALTEQAGQVAILRKEGAGILTITGPQDNRTGTTTVNGGTLGVSGVGSLGSGATTVSGSGSILDLDRNDTFGYHPFSTQALTIQSGGLVTNGTAIDSGFNSVQTLALDGGELRVTGTARAFTDGDLFKFEAYSIRDSVTVTGSVASSITNPSAIANAGINIGGVTDLGGGVGSALTFNVADVTSSSAADLTVSAVLKNNYDAAWPDFAPRSNGLVKTGGGTLELTAINRYTGNTSVEQGTLAIVEPYLADVSNVELSATATLNLAFAATDTIDRLFINGVQQAAGTWGAIGNEAAAYTSPRITGSGLLNVTTPPPSGYAGWASGFLPAFTNTAADFDFENDGLSNGIEWVVGGDPTLNDAAPVTPTFNNTTDPNNLLFTYRRRDTAATDPNTTTVVEYGSNLTGWTNAQNGVNGVSIDATTDLGGGFHQVTVAIPRVLAASGTLFARLRVASVTP
jgi:autotransporter-associated beta strand protein